MDNQKKQIIKLTSIQKVLLDDVNKSAIFEDKDIKIPIKISFESIDINNLKKYNEIHIKISKILEKNNIEPHEILNLIDTYNGKHEIFNKFKSLIICRNLCILKNVYNSEQWNKHVNKIVDIFKIKYELTKKVKKNTMYDLLNDIIMDILMTDINTFDICQNRITLDNKNNLKQLNIFSFEDQKNIILKLLEKGCVKIE